MLSDHGVTIASAYGLGSPAREMIYDGSWGAGSDLAA